MLSSVVSWPGFVSETEAPARRPVLERSAVDHDQQRPGHQVVYATESALNPVAGNKVTLVVDRYYFPKKRSSALPIDACPRRFGWQPSSKTWVGGSAGMSGPRLTQE